MCRETLPEVPNIPNWQPVDNEELRFAKMQQWYVAASTGAVNAAAYSLLKGTQLRGFEACVVTIFILLVAAAGVGVIAALQSHMRTLPQRSEANPPWHRWSDVFWLLTVFVGAWSRDLSDYSRITDICRTLSNRLNVSMSNLVSTMSVNGVTPFDCPNCGAQYKLVRVETETALPDEQLTCRRCDGPLHGREGKVILKYFLVDGPRRRALGRRAR
jgi:hypothetical protein